MKHTKFITAAALLTIGYTGSALGAGLTDVFDSYVTFDEIEAVPSTPTTAEMRMADIYDPYILSDEIVVSKGCSDPAKALIADSDNPFVTLSEMKTASMTKKC